MGKEFSVNEVAELIEITSPEILNLDDLSLAMIGGGELAVAL
jgi:hypothetical protein